MKYGVINLQSHRTVFTVRYVDEIKLSAKNTIIIQYAVSRGGGLGGMDEHALPNIRKQCRDGRQIGDGKAPLPLIAHMVSNAHIEITIDEKGTLKVLLLLI